MIEVRNLTKKYANFTLWDVCLTLKPGEVCGLIGNNGAGKTTLLKSMMNMIDYEGQAFWGNELLSKKSVDFRRHVGFVADFDLAYRGIRLEDVYAFTKGIHRQNWNDKRFIYLAKDLFALDLSQKIQALSTGMKKKFWLALALAHNPKMLLLDEPTTGLDPSAREEIMSFISDLVKTEQIGVMFSTHIIEDLEMIADRVMIIETGRIIFNDSKAQYFKQRRAKNVD